MKFVIHSLIPNLIDEQGHQFIYHVSVKKAAESLLLDHCAWIGKECKIMALPKQWTHFFRKKNPKKMLLKECFFRLVDFCKIFSNKTSTSRLFFLESFNVSDLCACTFASLLFLKKRDLLCILFRYDTKQLRWQGKLHFFLAKLLKMKIKARFFLLTDSEKIAAELEKIQSPLVMPIPHTPNFSKEFTVKASFDLINCWWPGEPRVAKGAETIQRLTQFNDPLMEKFLLFASEEATFLFSNSCFLKLRVLPKSLSTQHYLKQLASTDLIFLPYDPTLYRASTSGIFVEAIYAGCMPLVSAGTWMADELLKFELRELIVDWNNPLFFSSAANCLNDPTTCLKLQKMQKAYQKFHSISTFADKISAILQSRSSFNN